MSKQTFVAINYITCTPEYITRFEELFGSRAKAIDEMPGFQHMYVLKPQQPGEPYLVVSHWDTADAFSSWTKSEAFKIGHQRAFADLAAAKANGTAAPMHSKFITYEVVSR